MLSELGMVVLLARFKSDQTDLRPADLRLTRRGVLLHRLLGLDLLHEDAVTAALADLGLPRS